MPWLITLSVPGAGCLGARIFFGGVGQTRGDGEVVAFEVDGDLLQAA